MIYRGNRTPVVYTRQLNMLCFISSVTYPTSTLLVTEPRPRGSGSSTERLLTRISHTPTAATRDKPASTSLRLLTVLEVLSSTPLRAERRAPRIHRLLTRFASPRCEKCGLSAPTERNGISATAYSAAALLVFAVFRGTAAPPEVTVAAAANLTEVFQALGPVFESATGIHPVFSFGSTAQLAHQIENSAPYDVFTAADAEHVDRLDRKGLLAPGSRAVYAVGVLALWIPPRSTAHVTRVEDLGSAGVRVIAAAKPELAPYGQATVETLERLRLWERVKSKMVYASNISMARQYGTSGNADAVFTAYALVLKERGTVLRVDENLHQPIVQALGIASASKNQAAARLFVDFLLKGKGRDMLVRSGYRAP
jgi:molybdate transport system substrate-binding protein